jgi:hypothetical protein
MQEKHVQGSSPWSAGVYQGMIGAGLVMAVLMRILPPQPQTGLTLAALLGLMIAAGLVVRVGMRFSLPPEILAGERLDLRGFLKELPVALAVFVLYLGLTVAVLWSTVPA